MTRRSLLTIMSLLIASAWWTTASDAVAADANLFMNQLWGRTVEVLSKKVPRAERQARFRQLYLADFDGPGIARFVLGRYWRSASEQEQQEGPASRPSRIRVDERWLRICSGRARHWQS